MNKIFKAIGGATVVAVLLAGCGEVVTDLGLADPEEQPFPWTFAGSGTMHYVGPWISCDGTVSITATASDGGASP